VSAPQKFASSVPDVIDGNNLMGAVGGL